MQVFWPFTYFQNQCRHPAIAVTSSRCVSCWWAWGWEESNLLAPVGSAAAHRVLIPVREEIRRGSADLSVAWGYAS